MSNVSLVDCFAAFYYVVRREKGNDHVHCLADLYELACSKYREWRKISANLVLSITSNFETCGISHIILKQAFRDSIYDKNESSEMISAFVSLLQEIIKNYRDYSVKCGMIMPSAHIWMLDEFLKNVCTCASHF